MFNNKYYVELKIVWFLFLGCKLSCFLVWI